MIKSTISVNNFVALLLLIIITVGCQQQQDLDLQSEQAINLEVEISSLEEIAKDDPNTAIAKADEIISQAESIGSTYMLGKAKFEKARIYDIHLNEVSDAYFFYKESLSDLEESEDGILKMRVLNNLAILYRFYGEHETALELYDRALTYKSELTPELLSDLYFNIGYALEKKGDSDAFFEAEEAYEQSMKFAKETNYDENIASIHNQIGEMYKAVEDYEMARISYKNIIRTYQSNPEMSQYVGLAYQGIGETHFEQGNTSQAIESFEKALVYKTKSGSIFYSKFSLGTALLKSGYKDEAITTWKEGLNENHDKTNPEQVKIYAELSDALADVGQFKEALGYSQIYNSSMKDILEQQKYESNNQVMFADIVREYDEFNRQEPLYAQNWFILVLILGFGGIVFLVALRYQKNKSKLSNEQIARLRSEFRQLRVD